MPDLLSTIRIRYTALRESSETAFARIPTRHPRMGLAQPCWRQLLKSASPSRNLGNEIERIIEVSITHLVGERSWMLCSLLFQ
jgi:hypothetical protein